MASSRVVVGKGKQPAGAPYSRGFRRTIARMRRWLPALLALAPCAALSATIAINEPWLRPASKGSSSEVFMELGVSERATLVDVRSPVAANVALAQGSRRSAPPFALELPAQQPVALAAGGTRIVLTRVARPLARGDRVPLTLVLRYADGTTQDVEVDAEVRRRSPSEDHGHGGHRH